MKTLKDILGITQMLKPAVYTATQNCPMDLADCASNDIVVSVGTITDGTFTAKMQEGNAADYSDMADTTAYNGTLGALAANTQYAVGYTGLKRYVRIVVTVTGSPATGAGLAVLGIRGNRRKQN